MTCTTSTGITDTWSVWFDSAIANGTSTSTIGTASTVWDIWTSTSTSTEIFHRAISSQPRIIQPARQLTGAELEAMAAQERARHERERQRQAAWEAGRPQREAEDRARAALRLKAEETAEELLLAILTQEQRETYRNQHYVVITGRSGKRYRVRRGRSGNIDVINREGRVEERLCAHPGVACPDSDTVTAQLLHLQADEEGFWRKANRHGPPWDNHGAVLPALMH